MTNDDLMTQQATRAFGVGCFNFRLVREVPFQFKASDYADHIERALCNLTSLSDLEITYAASAENIIFYIEENIPPLADGGFFHFYHPEEFASLFLSQKESKKS